MANSHYKARILDLAQRWHIGLLSEAENNELETWFRSLEDTSLGVPVEMSVDQIEKRLHQMFEGGSKEPNKKGGPPYPFK